MSRPPDPSQCDAPASEVRQTLRRLASEGDWAGLLEQSERAVARPEGRAWLDAHRFALRAMAQSYDPDRSAAAGAVRALLRSVLTDFPELPESELSDGTPTANSETRTWLRDEVLAGSAPGFEPAAYAPPAAEPARDGNGGPEAEPDAWDLALGAVRAGRVAEGLQTIRRAMNAASTGRERFVRKLQLAELCLMVNNHRVALPLSEDLARQVDEFRLEQWEDEQLSARVWAALYRCLRSAGSDDASGERLRQVFTRLCRLDINQAMLYGDEPSRG
jgi:hypothetical protein